MNPSMFRKVALERLSSPEQLDQLLRVTTPKSWLALIALFGVLAVTVTWGFTGSIATKARGQGVIVRSGTMLNVVAVGGGIVTEVYVNPGDQVKPNQVVAKVSQPEILEKIRVAKEALGDAVRNRGVSSRLRGRGATLQVDAMARQKTNLERQIKELGDEAAIVREQLAVDEQLLAKGLIIREQTLARQQRLVTLNGQVEALRAQIKQVDSDIFNATTQPMQSDEQMKNTVAELQRNLVSLQGQLEMAANVTSPYGGQVVELRTAPGALVSPGSPVLSIQPSETALEVIVYLPSDQAKAVSAGMDAELSPSIVKREEYGFMRATVTYVADFPATPAAMMRNFENQTLVQSLVGAGPVTELRLAIAPDSTTPSGFRWSSGRGPDLKLSSGTTCTALIVVRAQKPFSLIVPAMKGRLGLS